MVSFSQSLPLCNILSISMHDFVSDKAGVSSYEVLHGHGQYYICNIVSLLHGYGQYCICNIVSLLYGHGQYCICNIVSLLHGHGQYYM